jgi:hypothetical protein
MLAKSYSQSSRMSSIWVNEHSLHAHTHRRASSRALVLFFYGENGATPDACLRWLQ